MPEKRWNELKMALETAKSHRAIHEDAWEAYRQLYSGRGDSGASTVPEDEPRSQLATSTVNIMVAAGQVAHPKILARPRRADEIGPSKIVEAFLDYWWEKYHVQREIVRADYDAKIIGHGWLKTTWVYRERSKGRDLQPPAEYIEPMVASAEEASKVLGPDVTPSREDIVRYVRKRMKQVAIDQPLVNRISPDDVWVDPQATVFDQRRWVAHRYYRRVEEVKADKNLNGHRSKVTGTAMEASPGQALRTRAMPEPDGVLMRAEMWEIWDYEDERLYIWATGCDHLLYDEDWPYAVGDPWTFIPCYEIPENFYPMGVIELCAPMIWEIDDLLTEQLLARRRQRVMHFMRKEDFTDDVRKAVESGIDRIVVPVDVPQGRMLNDLMYTVMPPPVNADLFRQEDMMKARLFQATGISEYQRGYAESGRTATEVDSINQYSTARVRLMVDGVQSAMVDVARKLVGLAQQNLTRRDVVRLVGFKEYQDIMQVSSESFMNGNEMVVPFTRDDIAGEFDFKLEPGSALPDGEVARKQAALQLSQILIAMPEANRPEIIRYLIKSFGETDPDRFLLDQQQMMPPPGSGAGQQPGQPPEGGISVSAQPGLSTMQPRPGAGAKPNPTVAAVAGRNNR